MKLIQVITKPFRDRKHKKVVLADAFEVHAERKEHLRRIARLQGVLMAANTSGDKEDWVGWKELEERGKALYDIDNK